jgi:hypothetical protein
MVLVFKVLTLIRVRRNDGVQNLQQCLIDQLYIMHIL